MNRDKFVAHGKYVANSPQNLSIFTPACNRLHFINIFMRYPVQIMKAAYYKDNFYKKIINQIIIVTNLYLNNIDTGPIY